MISLKKNQMKYLKIFNKNEKIDETNLKVILDLIKHEEIKDDKSLSDVKDLIEIREIQKTKEEPFHPNVIENEPELFKSFLINKQFLRLFLLFPIVEKEDLKTKYQKILIESTKQIFEEKWFNLIKQNENEKNNFIKILNTYNISFNLDDQQETETLSKQWAEELYYSLRYFLTERRKLSVLIYNDSFPKAVEAFTAMNTGGLPLSTFDIIAAKYAALSKKELLKNRIIKKFKEICKKEYKLLPKINSKKIFNHFDKDTNSEKRKFYNLYLNMLGLFSSKDPNSKSSIKEKHKISLTKDDINKHTDEAVISIVLAFRFLSGYCGVLNIKKLSYELMLLPIAKNLYDIYIKEKNIERKDILKILYWYWSALFGGRYREKQNSRSIEDIKALNKLLKTNEIENSIKEAVDKVFNDKGYSDLESLMKMETP